MTKEEEINRDLLKGDEDISPAEFALNHAGEPDFGNWPEIVFVFATAILVWFTFTFTG